MIPRHYRPYVRLAAIAIALVPLALLARSCRLDVLRDFVYRTSAREMERWDSSRDATP